MKTVRGLFDGTVIDFRDRVPINGYQATVESGVGKVAVAWGGNADTTFLKIPGDACARIDCWTTLEEFIGAHHGWLTRVDLAFDDCRGDHCIEEAVTRYQAGEFKGTEGGRNPKVNCAGNWIDIDGKGRTLYIGKAKNGKTLCVYEKGKQLGDELSPWVRWEGRFANIDRVLPLEMLTEPRKYLRGAYPALEFIGGTQARIRTRKLQERISEYDLTNHAQQAYGGLVDFLMRQGAIASELVTRLRRDAVPRRLSAPTADELMQRCNSLASDCAAVA